MNSKRLFIDEARIAVHLLHVNIVQVFDLGEIENGTSMAMEYVQGLDLSRLLTRARPLGPFPIPPSLYHWRSPQGSAICTPAKGRLRKAAEHCAL